MVHYNVLTQCSEHYVYSSVALPTIDGPRPGRLVGNHGQTAEDTPQGGARVVYGPKTGSRRDAPLLHVG